jgi:hypothetical protein
VIRTGLYEQNAVGGGMSDQRWIRSRHGKVVEFRRPNNTVDNRATERTHHWVTIRNYVLEIVRNRREVQWILHNR